ncbi:cyclophane-forming radical SAM/SPASM peptide maturase GrrM/OscB [Nonomuraea sp. NPDC000554]|uniref:cyclophane-forming radical SAM/SPASM peptide maturase GrrM/OscB n=1 Tax=Nonomuraea sp. NPDC000554 TaxID=3154259 RepID=UPI00331A76A8
MKIRLVVLQPTSLCNLNCLYCYVPGRRDARIMSEETLEVVIRAILESDLVDDQVEFLWHAGEPLTAGLPFYERAVELIAAHNSHARTVWNAIQTNGTLLDDTWARFLAGHRFSVGLSMDGPSFLHDRQRPTWGGRGSLARTLRGLHHLRTHGIEPGALCVLTRKALLHPDALFEFFHENSIRWLGFNVEEIENEHRTTSLKEADTSMMVKEYRAFMERIWQLWRSCAPDMVIREFEDIVGLIADKLENPSYMRAPYETEPFRIITVSRDGDVSTFSPEFAGAASVQYGGFRLGNLHRESLAAMTASPLSGRLSRDVAEGVRRCRQTCAYFDFCGGDSCPTNTSKTGPWPQPRLSPAACIAKPLRTWSWRPLNAPTGNGSQPVLCERCDPRQGAGRYRCRDIR